MAVDPCDTTCFQLDGLSIIQSRGPAKTDPKDAILWSVEGQYCQLTPKDDNQKNAPKRREHPGCNICILALDSGTQLISKHINIRPDLKMFYKIKPTEINVS